MVREPSDAHEDCRVRRHFDAEGDSNLGALGLVDADAGLGCAWAILCGGFGAGAALTGFARLGMPTNSATTTTATMPAPNAASCGTFDLVVVGLRVSASKAGRPVVLFRSDLTETAGAGHSGIIVA
jgi:hypothetical protein